MKLISIRQPTDDNVYSNYTRMSLCQNACFKLCLAYRHHVEASGQRWTQYRPHFLPPLKREVTRKVVFPILRVVMCFSAWVAAVLLVFPFLIISCMATPFVDFGPSWRYQYHIFSLYIETIFFAFSFKNFLALTGSMISTYSPKERR